MKTSQIYMSRDKMDLNTLAEILQPDFQPYQYEMVLRKHSVKPIYTFGIQLEHLIRDFVNADCWAITYGDEILYNTYTQETRPTRESIINDMVRDTIIKSPRSSLLVHVARQNRPTVIRIWMHRSNRYVLQLHYDPATEKFRASMYATEAYGAKSP